MSQCDRCHQNTLDLVVFTPELRALRCSNCGHVQPLYQKWVLSTQCGSCDISIQATRDIDAPAIACTRVSYQGVNIEHSPIGERAIWITCIFKRLAFLPINLVEGLVQIEGVPINAMLRELRDESVAWGARLIRAEFLLQGVMEADWFSDRVVVITRFEQEGEPRRSPFTQPGACKGCRNYHGKIYGGTPLICGMHPSGWDGDECPDWEEDPPEPRDCWDLTLNPDANPYYILEGQIPTPCRERDIWSDWMESANRQVHDDRVDEVRVSTVFTGLDHGFGLSDRPLLFETMVFGGAHDRFCRRYSTWEEAEAGHLEVMAVVTG